MSENAKKRIVRTSIVLCVGALVWLIGSDAMVTPLLNTVAVGVLVIVPVMVAVVLTDGEA